LDIGANIGSVTLPLAKLFNKASIYSIEPTNYAFKKLKENLSLNESLKNQVLINQLFISDKKNPKKVWSSWNFNKQKNKHSIHRGNLKLIKANSRISLDDFIRINKIKHVDFIKLDVDGYEFDVFRSGKNFFKKISQ
jgi:FkbM family methyltransferase